MKDALLTLADARSLLGPIVRGTLDDDRARRLAAVVVWSFLVEPGDGVAGRLIAALGAEDALIEVAGGGRGHIASAAAGLTERDWKDGMARWRPRLEPRPIRDSLEAAARAGVWVLTPDDPEWPGGFVDLGDHAPLSVWVRGRPEALACAPAVALVGARAATAYGEHVAMELSAELVGRGVSIVSGAAYGIDGSAHRAALAAGGTTIALLAGGADRAYPAGHAQLLERIAATGAVVSEVPCGAAPTKWRFLQRNRLIAALGDATVVVEAGWRSGSLNTAAHAATLSRPVGAVPGPITSAASVGCHRLLREFDARCVTSADDVMEMLGFGGQPTLFDMPGGGAASDARSRTDDVTRVLDALSTRSARAVADISRRSGLAPDDVAAILGLLRLGGSVVQADAGWKRITSAMVR